MSRRIRQYGLRGFAGLVQQTRSRQTGTLVGIYHAEQARLDPTDGPFATVCEDHGSILNHATLTLARHHAPAPAGWCDGCRDLLAAREALKKAVP